MSIVSTVTSAGQSPGIQQGAVQPAAIQSGTGTPFGNLFAGALDSVDALEDRAHTAVDGLMKGAGVDVHEAMIATQKASMAFELALAVRNKAVQAYQSIMGMQF